MKVFVEFGGGGDQGTKILQPAGTCHLLHALGTEIFRLGFVVFLSIQ